MKITVKLMAFIICCALLTSCSDINNSSDNNLTESSTSVQSQKDESHHSSETSVNKGSSKKEDTTASKTDSSVESKTEYTPSTPLSSSDGNSQKSESQTQSETTISTENSSQKEESHPESSQPTQNGSVSQNSVTNDSSKTETSSEVSSEMQTNSTDSTTTENAVSEESSSEVTWWDTYESRQSGSSAESTPFEPKLPQDPFAIPDMNSSYPQRKTTEYYYKCDTAEIDIKQYRTFQNNVYWLAHIKIDSPDQIKGGLANDTYGGFEKPSDAAKRLGWILGINGSYFDWDTGKPKGDRPVIKNGVSSGTPNTVTTGNEICLLADGTFFTPDKGLTAERLIEMGVRESWTTYDPLMISGGERQRPEVINHTHPVGSKNYPRTAIGMVKPCEYYIIVAGDLTEESGVSFIKMQDIFYDLGCVYARSFDGGGSSSLVFKDTLINVPKGGSERAVVDFLYFVK